MNVLGLQSANYSAAKYPIGCTSRNNIGNAFGESLVTERSSSAPGGNYHGTLKMGY